MQLKIKVKSGGEVKWKGAGPGITVYYGGPPPESGAWKLDTEKIEDYFDSLLEPLSYGESIDVFVLGFDIADLEGWGPIFTRGAGYTSYRPKTKWLISVGQLNWPDVKDLSASEQFVRFSEILLDAIARTGTMKRKPRSFDPKRFATDIERLLAQCQVDTIELDDFR